MLPKNVRKSSAFIQQSNIILNKLVKVQAVVAVFTVFVLLFMSDIVKFKREQFV